MRYRCKLCGQPKQNHTCPYQQSLQRSIGVTVYLAVNAYTADEPGRLAPALSDINNFVHGQDDFTENTPSRPDQMMEQTTGFTMDHSNAARNAVTLESIRSVLPNTSSSLQPTLSYTPHRHSYPRSSEQYPPQFCHKMIIRQPTPAITGGRGFSHPPFTIILIQQTRPRVLYSLMLLNCDQSNTVLCLHQFHSMPLCILLHHYRTNKRRNWLIIFLP